MAAGKNENMAVNAVQVIHILCEVPILVRRSIDSFLPSALFLKLSHLLLTLLCFFEPDRCADCSGKMLGGCVLGSAFEAAALTLAFRAEHVYYFMFINY